MGGDSLVLYVGATTDLEKRIYEHKNKYDEKSFTARYNINKLLYFEIVGSMENALGREKQLKRWKRERKLDLIKSKNISFQDLSDDWYD